MDQSYIGTEWNYLTGDIEVLNEASWRDADLIGVQFTWPAGTYNEHSVGQYRDTLFFSADEWDALTDDALIALETGRHDNWINVLYPPTPPVEDYEAQLDDLGETLAAAAWQRSSLANEMLGHYPDAAVPDWPALPFTIT